MLAWLEGVTDPYEAQDRLRARIAEASADAVARELASALASAALGEPLRASAVGLAAALADDMSDDALAVELLVHVGPSDAEHPEAALAALARGVARAPDDARLYEAVRAAARRSRQRKYDARHGRDWLERCVREGTFARSAAERFDDAVERAEPPKPGDALFARACLTSGEAEIESWLGAADMAAVAEAIAERAPAVDPSAPEAPRLAALARALRERLPPSPLRAWLALAQACLLSGDFQLAFPCAVAALAEDPKTHRKAALALVALGFESSPDLFADEDVDRIVTRAGVSAADVKRLATTIAKARVTAG